MDERAAVKRTTGGTLWIFGLILAAVPARAGGGYKAIAKEFSRTAQREGLDRVAVLPFVPTDGSNPNDGWSVSERLTTQIVRYGKVLTVERSLLEKVMEEHFLARTGAIDPATIRQLGKILAVDAIVTGSFVNLGREVDLNARLIDVQTGAIVAAAQRSVPREWFDSRQAFGEPFGGFLRPSHLWGPRAAASRTGGPSLLPVLDLDERSGLRDSPGAKCAGAPRLVDALERSILDIKARFWASQVEEGIAMDEVKGKPGDTITDPDLRAQLEVKIRSYAGGAAAPLSEGELRQFMLVNERAFRLHRDCVSTRDPGTLAALLGDN